LQGIALTYLRYDVKCGTGFVAHFLENRTVKEFWRSAQHLSS